MFKRKKQKNNAGKIRRARVKNARKAQSKKTQQKKRLSRIRKKPARNINWKKIGVIFLMGCFVVFTAWVLFFSKAMQIGEVEITGYDEKKGELQNQIRELGKRTILNQEIDNNLALFPSKQLARDVKEKYSVVKEVNVRRVFPDKLDVEVTKRQRVFLWEQLEGCQLLDSDGDIIEEFDCGHNEKELLKICSDKREDLGLDCQVFIREGEREKIVNKETIQTIMQSGQQILEEIKTTFYFEEGLIVVVPNPASKEIKIKSESHGEIWFSIDDNLTKQLEKFRALLEKKINSDDLGNMQYIDLRLSDKIIYRFKEGYNNEELIVNNEE